MKKNNRLLVPEYGLLILLAFLWGSSFTLIKVALESYPPATITFVRVTVAGAILLAIVLFRGVPFPRSTKQWLENMFLGIIHIAIPFTLINWGEQYIDSGLASVINSTPPMFVFILTVFFLKSAPMSLEKLVGVVFGLTGVFLISGVVSGGFSSTNFVGAMSVLSASIFYACGAIFSRRFKDQNEFVTATISLLSASMVMLPLSFFFDKPYLLSPTFEATLALGMLAVFSTALAFSIFFRLVNSLGPLSTTTNAYLRALFSVMLGIFFLGETFSWNMVVAAGFIFVGVALVLGQIRLRSFVNRLKNNN